MTISFQQRFAEESEVLVQLSSFSRSGRSRHDALPRNLRCIGERRSNIFRLQLRIGSEDLALGLAAGEEIEDQRHPDASALNAGLAETDPQVDGDSIERTQD